MNKLFSRPCWTSCLFASDSVRWAQVGKLIQKIVVRPNVVSCHLPVGENSKENIRNVVDEPPAVVREGRGTFGVVAQKVRQQFSSHPRCFFRCIPARVFQRVREDRNEMCIVHWLPGEVSVVLLAGKKGSLVRPRPAIRLDPAPTRAVCWNQRASPQPNLFRPKKRVGHFQHDAASILVREEIPTRELKVVERAQYVEEKGIAAPTGKEPVVTSLRHMSLVPCRNRHSLNDNLPARARFGGL